MVSAAIALTLALVLPVVGQDANSIFPLRDVQPGMKGTGRTVFEGNKVEDFQVEFLGVLENALAPKHSVILARLSGGPLERTGVIAGMSGSPVYIDGKLVGAVALSFPFAKEAYAGITPIEDMLEVVPAAVQPRPSASRPWFPARLVRIPDGGRETERLIPDEGLVQDQWEAFLPEDDRKGSLTSLRLPLRFAGISSEAVQTFASLFRRIGLDPLEGGGLAGGTLSTGEHSGANPSELVPGSMISLLLVRGDLNINVDCTVTLRQENKLYACGHRIVLAGPVEFPFASARVLATIPNLASSFKVDAPGAPVGTIRQDRFGAIYGVVGEKAAMIPVHIKVNSTLNREEDYSFEMIQQPFLSPFLLNLTVISAVSATERLVGPTTLDLRGNIRLSSGERVNLEDVDSTDMNAANLAAAAVSTPLAYILASDFPGLRIEGIDLSVGASNEKRLATLEQAWSSKSEVRPGERIEVTALLRTPSGESVVERIPVDIPGSVRDKNLSIVVGSGSAINLIENRLTPQVTTPRDLAQLVRALNRMRRNNRVYALLMAPQSSFVLQGDEYPSPPPSLIQTFLADPAVSSSLTFRATSVIADYETKPSPYSIREQKTLFLKVVSAGP